MWTEGANNVMYDAKIVISGNKQWLFTYKIHVQQNWFYQRFELNPMFSAQSC